jgi:hypothetical protein
MKDYKVIYKWVELFGEDDPAWRECETRRNIDGVVFTHFYPMRLVKDYPPEVAALHMASLSQSRRDFFNGRIQNGTR